ncbi:transketolase family protein [Patescibacteria group bacterium]
MRKTFINQLLDQAILNKDIILLTGDLGFTVFEEYQELIPDQFINIGVAEANMMGLAAGLALTGKIPIAYSIASFATARPFEQIKLDIALHKLPVVIVGIGSGLSYSTASVTHQALDDIAIMNTVPNMTILSPSGNFETKWAVSTATKLGKPIYLRLSKNEEPDVYEKKPNLKLGRGSIISKGSKVAILSTGMITSNVMLAAKILENKGINPTIISMHTLKPFDHKLVKRLARNHKLIVTVEEHSTIGGLGSIVSQSIMSLRASAKQSRRTSSNTPGVARRDSRGVDLKNTKLLTIAVPDKFLVKIGSLKYLRAQAGLSPAIIAHKILRAL